VLAALDALVIALYVEIDDFLEPRPGPGRPPKLSDAELITLAVAQVSLGLVRHAAGCAGRAGAGCDLSA
jgi:hypothetical protein